jgi:hypothetical protein
MGGPPGVANADHEARRGAFARLLQRVDAPCAFCGTLRPKVTVELKSNSSRVIAAVFKPA